MEVMHFKSQKERLDYLRGGFEEIVPTEVKPIEVADLEKECGNCPAWSGTDCTRLPYTEGCLKDEVVVPKEEEKPSDKATEPSEATSASKPKKAKKGKKKDGTVQAE